MKKLLFLLTAVFILTLGTVTAFAHGHGARKAAYYSVCDNAECIELGLHAHSGHYYKAHFYGDGHDYHGLCDFEGCETIGYHNHGESYCFGVSGKTDTKYYPAGGCCARSLNTGR